MSARSARSLAFVAFLLALVLGGCGGGGDESASTSSSPTQADTAAKPAKEAGSQQRPSTQAGEEGKSAKQGHGDVAVSPPPISSAPMEGSKRPAPGVKTVKGADNSVQTYGVEASDDARTEAAIALQAFLDARSEADWERVCSYLAPKPKEELEKYARSASAHGKDVSGCPGALAALGEGASRSQLRKETRIEKVLSFRSRGDLSGDLSFLIFLGSPDSTLYSMPMYLEEGEWKVGLVAPSELPV